MLLPTFLLYSAAGTLIWTSAPACAGVILQANFALVGDYVDIATNVVLGALGVLLVRRYVKCWRE